MKPEGSVGVAQPGKAADSRSVALVAREFESPPRREIVQLLEANPDRSGI